MEILTKTFYWMGLSNPASTVASITSANQNATQPNIPATNPVDSSLPGKPIGERKPGTARFTAYITSGAIGHASLRLETDDETLQIGNGPEKANRVVVDNNIIISIDDIIGALKKLSERGNLAIEGEPRGDFVAKVSFDISAEKGQAIAQQIMDEVKYCDEYPDSENSEICQYSFIGNNCVDYVQRYFQMTGNTGHFSDFYTEADMVKVGSPCAFYARPGLTTFVNWMRSENPKTVKFRKELSSFATTVVGGIGAIGLLGYAVKRSLFKPTLRVSDQPVVVNSLKNTLQRLNSQSNQMEQTLDGLAPASDTNKKQHRELISAYVDTAFELDDLENHLKGSGHTQHQLQQYQARIHKLEEDQAALSQNLS